MLLVHIVYFQDWEFPIFWVHKKKDNACMVPMKLSCNYNFVFDHTSRDHAWSSLKAVKYVMQVRKNTSKIRKSRLIPGSEIGLLNT